MDTQTTARTGWFATIAVVVATAVAWLAWFAWDTERTTDPVTGDISGPYETWQVIGCGITLLAIAVFGAWRLDIATLVVSMTVTFTAGWSACAIPSDDSGLWAVGALMVAGGMTIATLLTHALVDSARRHLRPEPAVTH